ncbi:hypothetical protein L1987_06645 [Smallanthus sonchifolius]|uniref:Uncharacterized protein n=1 Tax=Smallanthus sonchifolius TaxID=185202 RepID=A0ACB9JZ29_9ASTR|nr:hypothetical protein L1987_06645 [Smallanthus sonchifolius]
MCCLPKGRSWRCYCGNAYRAHGPGSVYLVTQGFNLALETTGQERRLDQTANRACELIEPAVKEGFYYHHAEPKYLMLVHWIPVTANTLPPNASHRVGVGAFVMKQNGEFVLKH